jgi:hypothetical protein
MQYTGFRKTTRGGDSILDRGDRASRTPNVIYDERGSAAQFVIRRELDDLGPGNQLCLFTGRLCGKIHRGGQDVGNIHGFGEHPAGNHTTARNHDHCGEFTAELRDEMIDQSIHLLPSDHFAAGFFGCLWLHADSYSLVLKRFWFRNYPNTAANGAGAVTRIG